MGNNAFAEVRGGGYWFHFPTERQTEALRSRISYAHVRGGNQNRVQDRDRPQVLGSVSYFKDNWLGTHNLKVGGNYFREEQWTDAGGFPEQVVHVQQQPADRGLADRAGRTDHRPRRHIGLRHGHVANAAAPDAQSRCSLRQVPLACARDAPSGQPVESDRDSLRCAGQPQHVESVRPRFGASWAVTEDNKNVVKFNYAKDKYDPGFGLAGNLTPNSNNGLWNRRFAWTDPNSNGVFDVGEQGRLIANQGGTASTALDPNRRPARARSGRGMSASLWPTSGCVAA